MDALIGMERLNFDLVRPLFAEIGVTDVHLCYDEGYHASNYCVGNYRERQVGVKFGRKPKYYVHEAVGLKRLDHEGTPHCYGFGKLKVDLKGYWEPLTFGYLISQHFPGGKLKQALDFLTKEGRKKAIGYLLGIVDIIDHMHSRNVVHNDIRPEHVIICEGNPRLIDFHIWEDAHAPTQDFCGRRGYLVEPFGFGRLLTEIVPDTRGDALLSEIKSLGENLTHKTDRYVYHPFSRDYTSRRLKEALEILRSSVD